MTLLRRWFSSIALSLVIVTVCRAAPIDPDNPSPGRFLDEWAVVYMADGKIGYVHSTMSREGNLIRTTTMMRIRVGRAEAPVEISIEQGTTETLEGDPRAFVFEMDASVMKNTMRGTVENGKITVISSQFGMDQTQVFDFPDGALMTWGLFSETLRRGFKPGLEYTLRAYVPEIRLDDAVEAKTTLGDWETFTLNGETARGQRMVVTLTGPIGSTEMISWIDKAGRPLKAVVPAPGIGDMTVITTDQATALADFVPPEIFMTTTIAAKQKIDRKNTQRITYRIRAKEEGVELGDLPVTGMQTPGPVTDGAVTLTVTRQRHRTPKPGSSTHADGQGRGSLSQAALVEFLSGNLMMNTDDPVLVKLAKRAAGGETDPYKLGDKLRRFVTDYVTTKSLNIGFATAGEVCRTREGDCSEHGVLLAALGRINKLPSRVVVGLAYVPSFGGRKDIFGYHLWTQFYIDGRWIDFDAALEETECSPARIAFATSSLLNGGLTELSLPLLTKMGAIDIDILEIVKRSGK